MSRRLGPNSLRSLNDAQREYNLMQSQILDTPWPVRTPLPTVRRRFRLWWRRQQQRLRHGLCIVLNGSHELYRAHTDTKLYQQCLLCGYTTPGWTINRRDRQLSLTHPSPFRRPSR